MFIVSSFMFARGTPLGYVVPPGTDPNQYSGAAWSPYLVGALIAVLGMVTMLVSKKALGASSAYAKVAGMIGMAVAPKHTASLKYFRDNKPQIDWEVMLVASAVLGAFLAAWQGGELSGEWMHPMWVARFGADSLGLRLVFAFLGGILMAFGARLAGGCTSGHGISGTMQLSVGSWVSIACIFIGGIITAMSIFRWSLGSAAG